MVDRADSCTGDRLGGDTADDGCGTGAAVPLPEALANFTTVELSEVTVLPAASWIVAVSTLFVDRIVNRDRAGECDLAGGAVDDGEAAEGAGGHGPVEVASS